MSVELEFYVERLERFEQKMESALDILSKKIDSLLYENSKSREELAVKEEKLKHLESKCAYTSKELDELKKELNRRLIKVEDRLSDVRVSLAEKVAYGAFGGGTVAILIQAAMSLLGHSGGA